MKIIHTSDWHIGQSFYRYEREAEHRHFFDRLTEVIRRELPDALVVSGDIYHNPQPSATAQALLSEALIGLHEAMPQMTIVLTAGNHDSASRLEALRKLWQLAGVKVVGGSLRNEDGTFCPDDFIINIPNVGHILAVPYFHPSTYPAARPETERDKRRREFYEVLMAAVPDDELPIVMMGHLAVHGCNIRGHEDLPVGGMLTEDVADMGTGYDYLALGHIHMPQKIGERIYYSGAAVPVSFSEDYEHGVNVVTLAGRGQLPEVARVAIEPLIQVKTIPADGAPLEDALEALAALDPDDDSYVRVLVDQEGTLAADANDRARKIAESKRCRFCEVRMKPRPARTYIVDSLEVNEVDDFSNIPPIDVARNYMAKCGCEISDSLEQKLKQAIELSTSNL